MKNYFSLLKTKRSLKNGFTLVETLVALSVLLTVLMASSLAIQSTFQNRRFAASQSVATYLANDALESIRQQRDNNLINAAQTNDLSNTFWDGLPAEGYIFTIDDSPGLDISERIIYCSSGQPKTAPASPGDTQPSLCPVLIPDIDGGFSYDESYSNNLINNSFRVFHRVTSEDSTKRSLKSNVVWLQNGVIKNLELVNEFANVNPPASSSQINQAAAGETAEIVFNETQPECNDGIDNDGNGFVDYGGEDPGCSSANDPIELSYGNPPVAPDFSITIDPGTNLVVVPQRGNVNVAANIEGIVDPPQTSGHQISVTQTSGPANVLPYNLYNSANDEDRLQWTSGRGTQLNTPGTYVYNYVTTDDEGLQDTSSTITISVTAPLATGQIGIDCNGGTNYDYNTPVTCPLRQSYESYQHRLRGYNISNCSATRSIKRIYSGGGQFTITSSTSSNDFNFYDQISANLANPGVTYELYCGTTKLDTVVVNYQTFSCTIPAQSLSWTFSGKNCSNTNSITVNYGEGFMANDVTGDGNERIGGVPGNCSSTGQVTISSPEASCGRDNCEVFGFGCE